MDGLLAKSRNLMQVGDYGAACDLIRTHIAKGENVGSKVLNLLGVCEARRRHFQMAREIFEQVLSLSPSDPSALTNLGNVALLEGNHQDAREMYTKALRANPLLAEPRFNIVLSYQDMGHFEKALTAYEAYHMVSKTTKWSRLAAIAGIILLLLFLLKR